MCVIRTPRASQRLIRANEHLEELQKHITHLVSCGAYQLRRYNYTGTSQVAYQLTHVLETTPQRWINLAGDAIHNLRSSLDNLVYELFEEQDKVKEVPEKQRRRIQFPIAETEDDYRNHPSRKLLTHLSADAQAALDAFRPFKGGNEFLWKLHQLSIVDKHHLSLSLTTATKIMFNGAWIARPNPHIPLKRLDYVLILDNIADVEAHPDDDIAFSICFDDAPAKGDMVYETLMEIHQYLHYEIPKLHKFFNPELMASDG
jgi:hypothetical protein